MKKITTMATGLGLVSGSYRQTPAPPPPQQSLESGSRRSRGSDDRGSSPAPGFLPPASSGFKGGMPTPPERQIEDEAEDERRATSKPLHQEPAGAGPRQRR